MYLCNIMFCIQWIVNEKRKKKNEKKNFPFWQISIKSCDSRLNDTIVITIIKFIAFDEAQANQYIGLPKQWTCR